MALIVPAQQEELVQIGEVLAHYRLRGSGKARLVIEGLKPDDVVRVCGVEIQIKPKKSNGMKKMHVTGPRAIPVRATGVLVDPDEEAKIDAGAGGGE